MLADLCSELWKRNCHASLQVFNSEVDNAGFDLVLKLNSLIRYVQIKQTHSQKLPPHCSTRVPFSKINGSCIVLISYNWDDLTISGYRFYGQYPHEPMQTIDGFRPSKSPGRRNAEGRRHIRNNYRNVPIKQFTAQLNLEGLLDHLFPSYLDKAANATFYDEENLMSTPEGTWDENGQITEEYVKPLRDGWNDDAELEEI